MTGRPVDQTHNHFIENIISPPTTRLTPGDVEQVIYGASVTITDAQIKAFGAGTPVDIVPAPGAGKFVMLQRGLVVIDAVAGAYSGFDAAGASVYLVFQYNGGSEISNYMDNTAGQLEALLGLNGEVTFGIFESKRSGDTVTAQPYDASEAENLPLALSGWNNGAVAFTGGDAANIGRVKVWYSIEDLP